MADTFFRMLRCNDSMSGGAEGSPQEKVFGMFFRNIDGCLQLMETQSAIASGSAVLHALFPQASWSVGDLDLYVGDMKVYGKLGWLLPWIDFLRSQGYRMDDVKGRVQYQESQVCVSSSFGEMC